MKKYVLFLLLCLTSVTYSETEMRLRNLENRVNTLENKNQKEAPQFEPITPNAGPRVKNGMDMFLTVDFIYWSARLDDQNYFQTGLGDLLQLKSPKSGHVYSVNWNWNPGFKVGYGWSFAHGGWDLYLNYSWYYSSTSKSKHSSSLQPTFTIIPPFATNDQFNPLQMTKGKAHWDLHYQVGDLELGRNYYINRYLKLRPFVGLKGTWQKQNTAVGFDQIPILFGDISTLFNYSMFHKQMLWGIGMRAGLNTAWQFLECFSLYGDFALTGMWTKYHISRNDLIFNLAAEQNEKGISTANLNENLRVVKPVFEFAIGLRLETYFHRDQLHVLLQAGWEGQIYPNQTYFLNLNQQNTRSDLSLHGLTARFRFDF